MTAGDYYGKYRQLNVRLANGVTIFGVDVHEYRNASDVFNKLNNDSDKTNDVDEMPEDFDAGAGWKTGWGALGGKIAQHGKLVGSNQYRLRLPLPTKANPTPSITLDEIIKTTELARVFTGKGTPELCAKALQLAEAFGLVKPTVMAMQSYCDDFIGLDCNGFVGNYLQEIGCTLVGPETPAQPAYFTPPGKRLTKLEDIKANSVLAWKAGGHVAIVDRIIGRVLAPPKFNSYILRCDVCESTGARHDPTNIHTDGLHCVCYDFYPPSADGVFLVDRGLLSGGNMRSVNRGDGSGVLSAVYIANLK